MWGAEAATGDVELRHVRGRTVELKVTLGMTSWRAEPGGASRGLRTQAEERGGPAA